MGEFSPKYLVMHDYGGTPRNADGMFNPYHALVFPDGSIRYRNPANPYGQKAPHAYKFNPDSVGLSYAGQVGSKPTGPALETLKAEYAKIQKQFPGIQALSHGEAYNQTRGTPRQASKQGRDLDEASWRDQVRGGAGVVPPTPTEQASAKGFSGVPQNRDGIVSTAGLKPPQPHVAERGFAQYVGLTDGPPKPAGVAPPTVQQAAYSPTPAPKSTPGTNPTPGREVLAMNGLSPEQRRDALQGAFDRGNMDMVYVHDNNERVVARPGEPRWSPSGTDNPANAGPNFANTFMVENGYGSKPRPMDDSNPLKGSRYDDGTYTGQFPTAGVSDPITQRGPGMTPPGTQTPAPVQSQQPQIMASPPTAIPSYEAPTQMASFQPPVQLQPAGVAPPTLAANTAAPPMIKPSPYTQELATAAQPMQTAALQPPPSLNAAKPNAPGNVATTNTNVSQQLAALPAGSKGATEVAAGLPTLQVKENLGGTPQISPIATTETNAPNNTGAGRTAQAAAPESAPKPAGIAPPTKTATNETPTPNQVDVKTQPNIDQPSPSQVQSDKPSSRMALGGPGTTKPETEPVKPLQGLVSELFGIDQSKKPGSAGMNGPGGNSFPQWNLNPANPGVTFSGGSFFGFGGG